MDNGAIMNIRGVDCYEKDGTAYLKLEAVARGLGFTQEKNGAEYVRWETVGRYLKEIGFPNKLGKDDRTHFPNKLGKDDYIPENVFYRLAMKAKNETAERFQALVADEVIPSIRKHGMFATPEAIRKMLDDPRSMISILTELQNEHDRRVAAENKILEDEPLVDFANQVSEITGATSNIHVRTMAKLLSDNGFKIGGNTLFKILRKNKILMIGNLPYQQYVDRNYFVVKESICNNSDGSFVVQTTMVTPKGQKWIFDNIETWAA